MADTNWPGMTNKALAAVLERAAGRIGQGLAPTDHQIQALDEAIERIREREDD